jgi:outer membrane murein-binding lipoprotein Lpp
VLKVQQAVAALTRFWESVVRRSVLSVTLVLGMALSLGLAQAPSSAVAPVSPPPADASVEVQQGRTSSVRGTVPVAYAGAPAVLEIIKGSRRQQLGQTAVGKGGSVALPVQLAGNPGTYSARWRVLRNGQTAWTGKPFTLSLEASKRSATAPDSVARILGHLDAAPQSLPSLQTRSGSLRSAEGEVAADATKDVAGDAAKSSGSLLKGIAGAVPIGIGEEVGEQLVEHLLGVGSQSKQIEQLSQVVQQDFATISAQLTQIESDLTALSTQISAAQQDVLQANASAAAGTCATLLTTANGYVNQIQDAFGNYQVVTTPSWFQANVVGQSPQAGINTVGNQIFGAGSGNPPFASGVVALQTQVTALGNLLNSGGPSGTAGLVAACATATSAGVASNFAGAAIKPVGGLDAAYFSTMHSIVSYYASWLALGQVVAADGGKLAIASGLANSPTFGSGANLCLGVTPQAGSAITCPGINYNTQQSLAQFNTALRGTGASWSDVSGGLLATNSTASLSNDYIIPGTALWVTDIATYGQNFPGAQAPTSYTSSGPLSSLQAAASSIPAASTGNALSSSSWLGLTFQPATVGFWNSIIPPAGAVSGSSGALMGQAGLANGGTTPSNLLVYVPGSSTFSISAETLWDAAPGGCEGWTCSGFNSFPNQTLTSASFIDANQALSGGDNIVIGAQSGSPGTILTAASVMNGAGASAYYSPACDTPKNGIGSCTADNVTDTLSLTMNSGTTQNASFYSPLTQVNTVDQTFTIGQTEVKFDLSDQQTQITAQPPFMTGTPQLQYAWPISPLSSSGQPSAPTPCTMATFTGGVDGSTGLNNVCANPFNEWLAGTMGIQTGPLSISAGFVQGTLTPAGNNVARAVVSNSSSSAQRATIAIAAQGASLGTVVSTVTGSSSIQISGASMVGNVFLLDALISPGASVLNIPIQGSYSGPATLNLALAGTGMYAASQAQITPTDSSPSMVPPPVSGLSVVTDSENSDDLVISWSIPAANPAVASYTFQFTNQSGSKVTVASAGNSAVSLQSGAANSAGVSQVQATVPIPAGPAGLWRVGVAAVSPGGTGPMTYVSATFGDAPPAAPASISAVQNQDGTLSISWAPVVASPALSNYSLVIAEPSGNKVTVTPGVPSYLVEAVPQVGTWTFSVSAVNGLGSSSATSTSLKVSGSVPSRPLTVDLNVSDTGWLSASWRASLSVPTADTYYLALYAPGASAVSQHTALIEVSASDGVENIRVPNFYQLSRTSPAGEWMAVVTPVNAVGVGSYAAAQILVTAGTLRGISTLQADAAAIAQVPGKFVQLAQGACASGKWVVGLGAFGSCVNGVFTPPAGGTTSS